MTVSTGIITTVAGNGTAGYAGDGGLATSAELYYPEGIAVDAFGNIYIADTGNYRVREVLASTGIISTIAGNGTQAYTGDGGLATSAELSGDEGVLVDPTGNIYIADYDRIRAVGTNRSLGATQLNATANIPGIFVYTPVAGTVLGGGSHTLSATFNPTDYTDYSTATATVMLNVTLPTPTLSVASSSNPSTYGGPVTFTATISSGPTGTVTFWDGTAVLGTGNIPTGGTTATFTTSALTAGTHTITASWAGNSNYSAVTSAAITQTVNKAVLTVTANNASRVYGAANPTFTDMITGFVNGDTSSVVAGAPSLTTTAMTISAVGSYTITAAAGTLAATNYSFTYVNGTLTVTRAVLTATANNVSRAYGAANPTFASTITGFVNGDTSSVLTGAPILTTTATTTSAVGSYTITAAAGTLAATNYSFTYVNGTLTIAQAVLTVTVTNASRAYGAANPIFAYTTAGYANSDTSSVVSGAPILTTTATTTSAVGSYTITAAAGTLAATNYSFAYVNGTLTVTQATPSVSLWPTASAITYGQTLASSTLSGGTASVGGSFAWATPSTAPGAGTPAESVTFTPSSNNYNTVIGAVNVTVNQATPVITWPTPAPITYAASTSTTWPLEAGIITTLAGDGSEDYSGDNGPATSAGLFSQRVAVDASGNLYIADETNNRVRKVTASTGMITTFAGNGTAGFSGDGGLATSAELNTPVAIALDVAGNLYIVDFANYRIRKVTASTGIISTVAGDGIGVSIDGVLATNSHLSDPEGVAVDASGNLYIAEESDIRKVTASTGIISTVAGGGSTSGDGGLATSAWLDFPSGVAVDTSGNIYIAESGLYSYRIRKVTASTGIISTVAGNGTEGYSGDGELATKAKLNRPADVAVDTAGNIYIADWGNSSIREVMASSGIIITLAGNGTEGTSGDDGPAVSAKLAEPSGVAVDAAGNIFIADTLNNRVRAIGAPNMILGPAQLSPTANVPGSFAFTPPAGTALSVGSTTLSTVFTPTDTADYTTANASVTLTVNPGTPTLSFPVIPAQTVGASPFAVNATSDSPAPITYTVTSGPALISNSNVVFITGAGAVVLQASQPATANYISATATTSFTVNPAPPGLSFTFVPEQYYGAAPFTVSATSASTGVITYSVTSGPATISGTTVTVTGVGTVVLSASQLATTNYTAATASISFSVVKATALIAWATPTPITSGTALSATQLNASAFAPGTSSSLSGTFSYSPASGTVLSTGSHALTVAFTPTDTTDYNTASTTVYLTVNPTTTVSDTGTVTLTITNTSAQTILSVSTNYGAGSTPSSIAEGLAAAANAANNSLVSVQAVNDDLYIQATPAAMAAYGSAGTNFSYSFSFASNDPTDFGTTGSFSATQSSGVLDGSASQNAPGTQVYKFTGSYDGVGNLASYTDSVMGTFNFVTGSGASGYDSLNRLAAGTLTPPSTSSNQTPQSFCWSYDAYGNRTAQAISSQPFTNAAGAPACQFAGAATLVANTGANYNANNQITGGLIKYDPAGDVTSDSNTGNTYLYDGEGRICAVKSEPVGSTYTMTGYIYDADGARVAKGTITNWSGGCNPDLNGFQPTSDYILGPRGEQAAEMSMGGTTSSGAATSGMTWQHTNVYAAGALIATYDNDGLHFYFNDPLGSRRAQTDYAGVLEQTCSSLPFGDQLTCTGSVTTPTEHHFTGKERDQESGNDYFGARYYASSMGRFMSPDWGGNDEPVPYADPTNPQSLNLYAYVRNNVLSNLDLDGHQCGEDRVVLRTFANPGDKDPQSTEVLEPGTGPCVYQIDPLGILMFKNNSSSSRAIPRNSSKYASNSRPLKTPPVDCAGYHYTDPIMGAVEATAKLGPEGQIGPIKLGFSLYKNLMTGQVGGKAEASSGLWSLEANNPTPEGGSLNGGGPANNEYSASLVGFYKNFTTGESGFDPSKSFSFGFQALVGIEFSYNSEKAFEIAARNQRCGVDK